MYLYFRKEGNGRYILMIGKKAVALLSAMVMAASVLAGCSMNIDVTPKGSEDFAPGISVADLSAAVPASVKVVANEDGTTTYMIPEEDHAKTMEELKASIEEGLAALTEEADPVFTSITHNKDYTEFKVKCSSGQPENFDPEHYLVFYYYGTYYNFFNGTPADAIRVIYFDENGNVIADAGTKKDAE